MVDVWDAALTAAGKLKGDLPERPHFASWIEHHALPLLATEIEARGITKEQEARVLIAKAPYSFCAWTDAGKNGFALHASETEADYKWAWSKGSFNITTETEGGSVKTYQQVQGWLFGNVGLHKDGGWSMTHIPSGLRFGARWRKIAAARTGVEAIHNAFNLEQVDRYDNWTKNRRRVCQSVINKYREFK